MNVNAIIEKIRESPLQKCESVTDHLITHIQGFLDRLFEIKSDLMQIKLEDTQLDEDTEINRLIAVKNDQIREKLKNREIIEELYQSRGDPFKTLLDSRNELVTKINDVLRHTGIDDENDIYMERYSSTVTNFSLKNFDNLRKCISRLNRKLTDLEYNGILTTIFV